MQALLDMDKGSYVSGLRDAVLSGSLDVDTANTTLRPRKLQRGVG